MNKRTLYLFVAGVAMLAAFAVFSRAVKKGAFRQADFAVTVKVQDAIDKSAHLRTSAFIGDALEISVGLAAPAMVTIAVLLVTGWVVYTGKGWHGRLLPLAIPVLFLLLTAAEIYGKSVVHHPSPPFMFLKNPTTHFPQHYSVEEFSYPSGHAARAVFIAAVSALTLLLHGTAGSFLARLRRKRTIILLSVLLVYIGAVSVSVIYLGHHWASDVAGGILLGMGTGLPAAALVSRATSS